MPKIVIREFDETTPGNGQGLVDIAFVPGLVDTTQPSLLDKDGKYCGIEKGVPTLFTSYSAFTAACGTKPVVFEKTQRYSDLSQDDSGFEVPAIPYTNIMFNEGDVDPGYVFAKELLAAGLPVLFQRLNGDPKAVAVESAPQNWLSENYYKLSETYEPVTGAVAPEFIKEKIFSKVYVTDKYELLEAAPEDWTINYTSYYQDPEKDGVYASVTAITVKNTVAPDFAKDTYYSKDAEGKYTLLNDEPEDWGTNYSAYFCKNDKDEYVNVVGIDQESIKAPDFIKNTFYKKVPFNAYEFKEQTSQPNDWETRWFDYYKQDGSLVRADVGETFAAGKFYTLDNGCDIVSIYKALDSLFAPSDEGESSIEDKGAYSFKYLTSGGYPVFEYNSNALCTKMLDLAERRGDCVALLDHTDNVYRHIEDPKSLYNSIISQNFYSKNGDFGAMFTPWATYNRTTEDKDLVNGEYVSVEGNSDVVRMPGSYAYLRCLADSIKTNASWLAVAGASRGVVPGLASGGMTTNITNGLADKMQPNGKDGNTSKVAINAITDIKPYGYTIWGNRTLKPIGDGCTATSFLNIRNLVSDVKKICYSTARALTFEQNNDVLWVNFKSKISPTLERMLSGAGISGYKFVRDAAREAELGKAVLCAKIILFPTYAVEEFHIDIVLRDDDVTVE